MSTKFLLAAFFCTFTGIITTQALGMGEPGIYYQNVTGEQDKCMLVSATTKGATTNTSLSSGDMEINSYANLGLKPGDSVSIYIALNDGSCSVAGQTLILGTYQLTINKDGSGTNQQISCPAGDCKRIIFSTFSSSNFPYYTFEPANGLTH